MAEQSTPTIAFLGTGLMGEPMCHNLLKAGLALTVWNRSPEKTKRLAKRGAEATTPGWIWHRTTIGESGTSEFSRGDFILARRAIRSSRIR